MENAQKWLAQSEESLTGQDEGLNAEGQGHRRARRSTRLGRSIHVAGAALGGAAVALAHVGHDRLFLVRENSRVRQNDRNDGEDGGDDGGDGDGDGD